ncbi:MAG TPA: hypothetical protein VIV60_28460 [Polyangiaceae bacterium]
MRRLLRRLAWLMARLLLVVAVAFVAISKATVDAPQRTPDHATDRIENCGLPRFFNLYPADLESRVMALVDQLSRGPSDEGASELQRLGGATLPFVVPRLIHLPEPARLRLAWAILPVAQRMTWRGSKDIRTAEQAYPWLIENWQERAVDFQPTVAARWVERLLARGGPALSSYIIEYDTYALPALMTALPEVHTSRDVEKARQLLWVARRATGLPWHIAPDASPNEARRTVEHWRRWWQLHSSEFVALHGPSRLSAMLEQTQFGQWSALVIRFAFGTTRDQTSIAQVLASAGWRTLILLWAGAIGAMSATLAAHWLRQLKLQERWSWPTLFLASIPSVATVALLRRINGSGSIGVASAAIGIAMVLGRLFTTAAFSAAAPDRSVPAFVDGAPMTVVYWRLAGHNWPWLLTLAFTTEKAFGVNGIGMACVAAFHGRDLHTLMAITTVTAVSLLLIEFAMQTIHLPGHSATSSDKTP